LFSITCNNDHTYVAGLVMLGLSAPGTLYVMFVLPRAKPEHIEEMYDGLDRW
jgi:hypothetical protein